MSEARMNLVPKEEQIRFLVAHFGIPLKAGHPHEDPHPFIFIIDELTVNADGYPTYKFWWKSTNPRSSNSIRWTRASSFATHFDSWNLEAL